VYTAVFVAAKMFFDEAAKRRFAERDRDLFVASKHSLDLKSTTTVEDNGADRGDSAPSGIPIHRDSPCGELSINVHVARGSVGRLVREHRSQSCRAPNQADKRLVSGLIMHARSPGRTFEQIQ
jgi:hypothetical protein